MNIQYDYLNVEGSPNIKLPQSAEDISETLKEVANSEGRLYVVVTKRGLIGKTDDKKQAASMEEVSQFIKKVTLDNKIFLSNVQLKNIKNSFKIISDAYMHKNTGFFAFIRHLFSSTFDRNKELIEEVKQRLKDKKTIRDFSEKDYGTYQAMNREGPGFVTKRTTYEKFTKDKMLEAVLANEAKGATNLDNLNNSHKSLNEQNILYAFTSDLESMLSNKKSRIHILRAFHDTLDELASKVEAKTVEEGKISSQEATDQFEQMLADKILVTNEESLEVDRELFEDIKSKLPDDPEVEKFRKEYNNGTWTEEKNEKGEVINPRTLTYHNISIKDLDETNKRLTLIVERPSFKAVLLKFFTQIQK